MVYVGYGELALVVHGKAAQTYGDKKKGVHLLVSCHQFDTAGGTSSRRGLAYSVDSGCLERPHRRLGSNFVCVPSTAVLIKIDPMLPAWSAYPGGHPIGCGASGLGSPS